jgi:hypothetical protein
MAYPDIGRRWRCHGTFWHVLLINWNKTVFSGAAPAALTGRSGLASRKRRQIFVATTPGRCGLRPRDRNSPLFDNFKRRVLTALDRSLDRNVPDADPKSTAGEAMWW